METVYLIRDKCSKKATQGILIARGKMFYTLENPWLDNKRNVSCFPSGAYNTNFLKRSASGRYRNVYHVTAVPKRSGILIHAGNITKHTKGCLLVGKKRGTLAGQPAILNSRSAIRKLFKTMGPNPFKLIVIGGDK